MGAFLKCFIIIISISYAHNGFAQTELRVCEWKGYIMPWQTQFEQYAKQQGVDVKLVLHPEYLSSSEQVFNLVRAKACDVITPTHSYFSQKNSQLFRSLLAIDYTKIPNYAKVQNIFKALKYKNFSGNEYAIPLLGGSYGLAYNADKVPEPDSFDVLFDPKNKCKITVTKAQYAANFYLAALKAGYDKSAIYDIDQIIDARGIQKSNIPQNIQQLYKNVCAKQRFWAGEADFSDPELLYGTSYWFGVAHAQQNNLNWKIAHKVRATVWLDTLSFVPTLKQTPEKLKAAYLLANFMLSTEVQNQIHQNYGVIVVNEQATQELSKQQIREFYQEDWLWQPLSMRTQGFYQVLHEEAFNALPYKAKAY